MEKAIHFGKPGAADKVQDEGKRESFLVRALDLISGTVMNLGLLLVVVVFAVYAISSH